ncbi:Transcriptional regulator [Candidatus Burkholderia humilis]|nr:Transcriptional regulator [Candidatus Burkholderia humilis]
MDQLLALRVFVRIAESGGFSKAADMLNMPKPTVTKLVQDLEAHLQVKLLQRSTRKVSVTEEGQRYYRHSVKVLADVDEMDTLFADTRSGPRGRLHVDIGSSLANLILLPHLPSFRAQYPHIQLEIGVDCVIRGGALSDTSLVARHLASLDWGTYAASPYVATRGAPSHPERLLAEHDVVSYFSSRSGRVFELTFERGDEKIQVDPRNARGVSVNESAAHLTSLVSGLGVGQTFTFMASPWLQSGDLVQVLSEWTRPLHPLHIVFPKSKHDNARMRAFVQWALDVFEPYDRVRSSKTTRTE